MRTTAACNRRSPSNHGGGGRNGGGGGGRQGLRSGGLLGGLTELVENNRSPLLLPSESGSNTLPVDEVGTVLLVDAAELGVLVVVGAESVRIAIWLGCETVKNPNGLIDKRLGPKSNGLNTRDSTLTVPRLVDKSSSCARMTPELALAIASPQAELNINLRVVMDNSSFVAG
jgi:hypothetical protein